MGKSGPFPSFLFMILQKMKYNSSIQILLDEINKRFEPGTFEFQPSNDPGIIGFKSNNHKEVYLSIVTTGFEKNKYSVQVTLEGEKYKQKIAEVDNTVLSRPELTKYFLPVPFLYNF